MFSTAVLYEFSLLEQLFPEKNDEQMTFDDSYICYVIKIDVFGRCFVLVYTNGLAFP